MEHVEALECVCTCTTAVQRRHVPQLHVVESSQTSKNFCRRQPHFHIEHDCTYGLLFLPPISVPAVSPSCRPRLLLLQEREGKKRPSSSTADPPSRPPSPCPIQLACRPRLDLLIRFSFSVITSLMEQRCTREGMPFMSPPTLSDSPRPGHNTVTCCQPPAPSPFSSQKLIQCTAFCQYPYFAAIS